MKEKKNIIKKISQFNSDKIIKLNYKKEIKFIFKKKNFKNKRFNQLLLVYYSIKNILKLIRYNKYNIYKTKNNLLINKFVYFNFITNGLDLKYDSQLKQDLYNNVYISNYLIKKTLISKSDNLDIIKLHKFFNLIENKYTNNFNSEDSYLDYFNFINLIYFNFLYNIYNMYKFILINKIN
jgi:hypothetical protein